MRYSQSTLERVTDEDDNFVECPECGFDDSDTNRGISMHFGYNHEGSISYLFRCEECGRLKLGQGQWNSFCSKWCEVYSRVGTFKHSNEGFLRKKIEGEGLQPYEVADEIDAEVGLVIKWIDRYDIGDEYECPGCDRSFATERGMSQHHEENHGKSISGYEYECAWCGEAFMSPRSPEDPKSPKYCNDDCFGASMEEGYRTGRLAPPCPEKEIVDETDHKIDSKWEKEIDLILYESDFDFTYNSEDDFPRFDLGDSTYIPDFIVGDCVIEVKSDWTYDKRPDETEKRAKHLTEHDDWTYIVVGNVPQLSCDAYVEYEADEDERIVEENREGLLGVLEDGV